MIMALSGEGTARAHALRGGRSTTPIRFKGARHHTEASLSESRKPPVSGEGPAVALPRQGRALRVKRTTLTSWSSVTRHASVKVRSSSHQWGATVAHLAWAGPLGSRGRIPSGTSTRHQARPRESHQQSPVGRQRLTSVSGKAPSVDPVLTSYRPLKSPLRPPARIKAPTLVSGKAGGGVPPPPPEEGDGSSHTPRTTCTSPQML